VAKSGTIDQSKVDAQIARRVVDRLVGYQVSPFIWKTVAKGLSAGRVQSVALRLICDREAEIKVFIPEEYWSIKAQFAGDNLQPFWAELAQYKGKKVKLPDKATTDAILAEIKKSSHHVSQVKKSNNKTNPYPPYTTSTLQQDASKRLRFSGKRVMRLAQTLYEGVELPSGETTGLITYMRTDSVRIASEALQAVRTQIKDDFGDDYLSGKPRNFKKKGRTQDAHEAIRPTDVSRTPDELKDVLDTPEWKLYDLIWRRFVASQMSPTLTEVIAIEIKGDNTLFRARGHKRLFDGFQKVYPLDTENGEQLPSFPKGFGDGFPLNLGTLEPKQHFTQPPPRYSEATLVKALDELGIGRPSTYAAIIATLFDRKYIEQEKRRLLPTELGDTVCMILVELFPDIFEVSFTARMEEQLDQIEEGGSWVKLVREFYEPFSVSLEKAEEMRADIKKKVQVVSDQICEKCGLPMLIKWGRRGKFLACSGFPSCKNSKPLVPPPTVDKPCPNCGGALQIREGRYGRFLGCSNYPECKHLEPIGTGVKCDMPDCEGEFVERKSKKGRFYSCNKYPECKNKLWKKPEPIKCDNCEHPYLLEDTQSKDEPQLICPNCKAKFQPAEKTEIVK